MTIKQGKNPTRGKDLIVNLVHFYSSPGGIEVLLPVCINRLPEYNFSSFVLRPPIDGERNIYSNSDIPVTYGGRTNIRAIIKLYKYASVKSEEIFHAYNIGPLFLLTLRLAGVKKIVYSIHGTKHWKVWWKRFLIRPLWQLALKKDYKIVSNSEFSKKVFLKKVSSKALIQVLYNPIDGRRFTPPAHRDTDKIFKIIYVGRLNKGKNLDHWIELAVKIHGVLSDTRFEIYGNGPFYDLLDQQIRSLDAERYVFMKAFRADAENIYRNADLLLFLSEYESFGNVVVESILCGTPAIVSDIPAMKEIFRDFPQFIVKVEDNLADNIVSKMQEKDKLMKLALKARDQFLIRFSAEAHIKALGRIYKSFDD